MLPSERSQARQTDWLKRSNVHILYTTLGQSIICQEVDEVRAVATEPTLPHTI